MSDAVSFLVTMFYHRSFVNLFANGIFSSDTHAHQRIVGYNITKHLVASQMKLLQKINQYNTE